MQKCREEWRFQNNICIKLRSFIKILLYHHSPEDILVLHLCLWLESSHQRLVKLWSGVDSEGDAEEMEHVEEHLLVEHHLREGLPLLIQQLGDDPSLQHVQMFRFGAIENDNQSRAPI